MLTDDIRYRLSFTGLKRVRFLFRCLPLVARCALVTALPAMARATPANMSDVVAHMRAYHDQGDYNRDLSLVTHQATQWLEQRAVQVKNPAVVLDVDETALSNWEELTANQFAHFPKASCDHLPDGPCGDMAWEQSARAKPIPQVLAFWRRAKELNVAVFFLTGRHEEERRSTESNLKAAGYRDWTQLILRPDGTHTVSASEYKIGERAKIESKGYHIIANIGDQPSDLQGAHADRSFLLPNPFYRIP